MAKPKKKIKKAAPKARKVAPKAVKRKNGQRPRSGRRPKKIRQADARVESPRS